MKTSFKTISSPQSKIPKGTKPRHNVEVRPVTEVAVVTGT